MRLVNIFYQAKRMHIAFILLEDVFREEEQHIFTIEKKRKLIEYLTQSKSGYIFKMMNKRKINSL
jgi:hypothetical protein